MSIAVEKWKGLPTSDPREDPSGISYKILPQGLYGEMMDDLAKDVADSGQRYDAVIAPLRGGVPPARRVAEVLGVSVYGIGVRLYDQNYAKGEAKGKKAQIYHDGVPYLSPDGRYLIVDDVNDTTHTFHGIREFLGDKHGIDPSCFDLAVVHEKPGRRKEEARFHVGETDAWIVYPAENSPKPIDFDFEGSDGIKFPVHYEPWEFWVKQLPSWMVRRDEDGGLTTDDWDTCRRRAESIGFRQDEFPKADDKEFQARLMESLASRYQELTGKVLPEDLASRLLPSIQEAPIFA